VAIGYNATVSNSNIIVIGNSNNTAFISKAIYNSSDVGFANVYVGDNGHLMRIDNLDARKRNITDLDLASINLQSLRPVIYNYDDPSKGNHFGLMAEEVAAVVPDLVLYRPEKQVREGSQNENPVPAEVKLQELPVLLLKQVQVHDQKLKMIEENFNSGRSADNSVLVQKNTELILQLEKLQQDNITLRKQLEEILKRVELLENR
jgi:hypothetical protein